MPSRRPRPRRLLLPTLLAAVLAAEITGIALARTLTPAGGIATSPAHIAASAAAAPRSAIEAESARAADPAGSSSAGITDTPTSASTASDAKRAIDRAAATSVAAAPARTSARAAPKSSTHTTTAPRAPAYRGVNRVWIPSLGIDKGIQSFPCSRSRPPDAGVYRWGCAGTNNVYLLSHAWSTFKPLHDAYVGGRLRTGTKVIYADTGGHVHTYTVIWWRVVAPTSAAKWAWASLSRPGMTLQTCVGANSAYRLMVRLTRVG